MSTKSERLEVLHLLTPGQLIAVRALVKAYEADQMEDAISSSEPEKARQRVLASREILALLNPPKGDGGQA